MIRVGMCAQLNQSDLGCLDSSQCLETTSTVKYECSEQGSTRPVNSEDLHNCKKQVIWSALVHIYIGFLYQSSLLFWDAAGLAADDQPVSLCSNEACPTQRANAAYKLWRKPVAGHGHDFLW